MRGTRFAHIAVVAEGLVGAFSVITNLRMQFGWNFLKHYTVLYCTVYWPRHRTLQIAIPRAADPGKTNNSRSAQCYFYASMLARKI